MMTLIEAIEHCKDMAKCEYGECAEEHRQLAEWLMELHDIKTHGKHTETHGVCSDLISRQAVLDFIASMNMHDQIDDEDYKYAECYIESLPSADRPTVDKEYLVDLIQEAVYDGEACAKLMDMVDRPTGEWVHKANGNIECSLCGRERQIGWINFCGGCGARMEVKEE